MSEDKFYNNPPFDSDSMGDLAVTIINKACGSFKTDIPFHGHDFWETKPLSALYLEYAARDGFYSYELYHRLLTVKNGLSRGTRKAEIVRAHAVEAEEAAAADEDAGDKDVADEAAPDEVLADAWTVEAVDPKAESRKCGWGEMD